MPQYYYSWTRSSYIPGKKLDDVKSISGIGRFTNKRIDAFQNLYGNAIRTNKGKVEAMSTLKHYCNTLETQKHEECPPGKKVMV